MNDIILIFKALSDKNRLRVFIALTKYDELCACQITELLKITGATASRHLGILINAGLIQSRKEGRWVYYKIIRSNVNFETVLVWIKDMLKDDLEMLSDQKELEQIMSLEREIICKKQRGESCC